MNSTWPFAQAENTAVITLKRILDGSKPILYVSHDADDGGWQFLDGEDVTQADAAVVALKEIVDFDASIRSLADLPEGWIAERDAVDQAWKRARK